MHIGDYALRWEGERPEGTDEAVRANVERELKGLRKTSDLIYHAVVLGNDLDQDPGVILEGAEDGFVCTYYARIRDAFVTGFPNAEEEDATDGGGGA